MSRKVQSVAPAPVHIACRTGAIRLVNCWSGKLDSNQRPLPPERVSPRRIGCFLTISSGGKVLSDGPCSRIVHGPRFNVNLNPCLYGVA
jgi:hypothetical protein